ncbi:PREDICTED: uncharacterized protein LOC103329755 [Prunus mume]|uniref:Uncharacterized protein LOC103329755 n=1 Tax=Prunus mume TaxID=102107 RepID=A0ABM0NVJ6_PRUMU|nr:PREDICTED: uncharacterized protein LOC103329755 [Prunus mume]
MCNKKSPPLPPSATPTCHDDDPVQTSSMIHNIIKEEQQETSTDPAAAHRKSRTKTRKPKFLSLRSQLSLPKHDHDQDYYTVSDSTTTNTMTAGQRHQLNLFPLHPGNLVDHQEKADMQDDNVALLFHSEGGATLNGLLTSTSTATTSTSTTTTMSSDREDQESFSTYAYYNIVRTAMRSRERETSVEKWVCYSELVDKKEEQPRRDVEVRWRSGTLALKLDYEEILNAWSDKGPLCIDGDPPQTVPDQLFQLHDNTPNGEGCDGNLWRVPGGEDESLKTKMGKTQREASVLRYKEKRQNRLFSKRIRYQVRKLNAEKRPRMKGRFVKKRS